MRTILNTTNARPMIDFKNTLSPAAADAGTGTQAAGERVLREYTGRARTRGLTFSFSRQ